MNRAFKLALPVLGAAAVAAATVFLVAPGKSDEKKRDPFWGRNFAHRGFHKIDKTTPENSLLAFNEAAENGYGIELDVRLSADGRVVVFHDDSLQKICGVEGSVEESLWAELKKLRLHGTDEGIPLLSEVLAVIAGRVPLIVELKHGKNDRELCERTYELISCYNGKVCIESFSPFVLRWFKKNAPEIMRGQIVSGSKCEGGSCRIKSCLSSSMLANFLSRPHFIAHGISPKSCLVRLCEKLGVMKVAWTSRDWTNEDNNDAVIFEFYRPRVRFK